MRNSYAVSGPVLNTYLVRERDRQRLRELGLVLLAIVPLAALLLGYLWLRLVTWELGYQVEALDNRRHDLQEAVRRLELEEGYLASPARIERRAATELGMGQPALEQLEFLEEGR